jgi:hypothetical protein
MRGTLRSPRPSDIRQQVFWKIDDRRVSSGRIYYRRIARLIRAIRKYVMQHREVMEARMEQFHRLMAPYLDGRSSSEWLSERCPGGKIDRFILVERSVGNGDYFLSAHPARRVAERYHAGQEAPKDWIVSRIVDLDTGEMYRDIL